MEKEFVRNAHIQFPDFGHFTNFCTYCTQLGLSFAPNADALKVIMTIDAWNRLPEGFRKTFGATDPETHRRIVQGTEYAEIQRRAASAATKDDPAPSTSTELFLAAILPRALMPRVK